MALFRVRLIGEYSGGVPDDLMSMSWGVDAGSAPSASALQTAFLAAWNLPSASTGLRSIMSALWGTYAWEVSPAAGGPVASYGTVARVAGTAGSGWPTQTTVPIQQLVSTNRDPARRGRLNIGPLGTVAGTNRPSAATMARLLEFCTIWHGYLQGLGATPVYLTNGGSTGVPIVGYTCANSFGMLRSRKLEPTSRTVRLL